MICFVVVGLVPFATFYYEGASVDGLDKNRFSTALVYECVVLFSFITVLLPAYFLTGSTSIPVKDYQYDIQDLPAYSYSDITGKSPYEFIDSTVPTSVFDISNLQSNIYVVYYVPFPVYLIALMGWIGWWFFSVFAGVGISSLPFDYILAYIYRPTILPPDEFAQREIELQERTNDLLGMCVFFTTLDSSKTILHFSRCITHDVLLSIRIVSYVEERSSVVYVQFCIKTRKAQTWCIRPT